MLWQTSHTLEVDRHKINHYQQFELLQNFALRIDKMAAAPKSKQWKYSALLCGLQNVKTEFNYLTAREGKLEIGRMKGRDKTTRCAEEHVLTKWWPRQKAKRSKDGDEQLRDRGKKKSKQRVKCCDEALKRIIKVQRADAQSENAGKKCKLEANEGAKVNMQKRN